MTRKCSVQSCNNPIRANGFCRSHNMRNWRYGNPLAGAEYRTNEPYKFLKSLVDSKESNCIIWPFSNMGNGYGDLRFGGRHYLAHRLMCKLKNGKPPSKRHQAAHECGKGHEGCVNPNHLTWKLPAENQADKKRHGTQLMGEDVHFAKLTPDEALRIRHGGESPTTLANELGISTATVYDIRTRKSWKHLE